MLYLSLIVLAVGLAFLAAAMRKRKSLAGTYGAVGGGVGLGLLCLCPIKLPAALVTMLVGTLLAVGWHYAGRPRRTVFPVLLAACAAGHLIVYFTLVAPDLRLFDDIRGRVVAVNPDDRLTRPANPAATALPRLAGLDRLDAAVDEYRGGWRAERFARLHTCRVDDFVNNFGFGVTRMIREPRSVDYYLPTREPIPQPNRAVTSDARPRVVQPLWWSPAGVAGYHDTTVLQFAFPSGWGWERGPNDVLGFQPHQLGRRARYEPRDDDWSPDAAAGWRVASIDLIGLVVHPKPTVYVTENLPRMDEAKAAPTRDPDAFEVAGLAAVAGGDELYLGRSPTEPVLRMVGGIRAAKSCTGCHGCREGELLGAFGYVFTK